MNSIIAEIVILATCIAFVAFLAWDDRKNRLLRAEEDKQKTLQQAKFDSRQN